MHEMSYVVRIVNTALKTAMEQGATRITAVKISVGEMTGIDPVWLQRYYPTAVKGTIMEGSKLLTKIVPVLVKCSGCSTTYHPSAKNSYRCPSCGSVSADILEGRGITITSVEIDDGR